MLSPQDLHRIASAASSPTERLRAPFTRVGTGTASPEAVRRLATWSAHLCKGDAAIFARVLRWRGVDPMEASQGLEPAQLIPGAEMPGWTKDLQHMLASRREPNAAPAYVDPAAPLPNEALFLPFVEGASTGSYARLVAMGVRPTVLTGLQRRLLIALTGVAHSALSTGLSREDFPREVFTTFPVLARLLTSYWHNWIEATEELLDRLRCDASDIAEFIGRTPGRVTSLQVEDADGHNGGRTVVKVGFESGAHIVYKPRDMSIDVAVGRLMNWLQGVGLDLQGTVPRVLRCAGYGWAEFIAHRHAADEVELRKFWHRAGQLLGVLTALGANDMHARNVIAEGARLVLVDLETMLSPAIRSAPPTASLGEAAASTHARLARLLSASAIGTLMLPTMVSGGDDLHVDLGALTAPGGADASHRPAPGDPEHELLRFQETIMEGFRTALRVMRENMPALVEPGGPLAAFAGASVRVVFRDTNIYFRLLKLSCDHSLLRDGADRDVALERLSRILAPLAEPPAYVGVVQAEKRALNELDIPRFDVAATGLDLRDRDGVVARGMFERDTVAQASERLKALSEEDEELHCRVVGLALQARLVGRVAVEAPPAVTTAPPATLLEGARSVGRVLQSLAIVGEDGSATWICPQHRVTPGFMAMSGLNQGLGDGALGIALFLTALSRVTGGAENEALRDAALQAFRPIKGAPPNAYTTLVAPPPGLLDGHGGVAWGMAAIARLGGPAWCLDVAADSFRNGLKAVGTQKWALHDGLGGLLFGGLSLLDVAPHAVDTDELRRLAASTARVVGAALSSSRTATGLMDGLAGAASSLAFAAAKLDVPEARQMALRSLSASSTSPHSSGSGFGRGSAGRLIALSAAKQLLPEEQSLTEALDRTARALIEGNHLPGDGLWNGRAGLFGALEVAGATELADAMAIDVAARAVVGGLRTVTPAMPGVVMPGLMNGISGVGLALLSRHDPSLIHTMPLCCPR